MRQFSLSMLKRHWQQGFNSPIARRFVLVTVLCSTFLAIIITAIQLYIDYCNDLSSVEENVSYIEQSRVPSIVESMWNIDERLIETQLQGMSKLEGVDYIEIVGQDTLYSYGIKKKSANSIHYTYPLERIEGDRRFHLGELKVSINIDHIYHNLFQKMLVELSANFVKTMIVAALIIMIYQIMIGQHVSHIANFARQRDIDQSVTHLKLQRHFRGIDELNDLETAINHWSDNQQKHLLEKQRAQEQYEVAVTGSSVGLWDWDIVNDTLYWSARFKEIIGIGDLDYNASFADFENRLHPDDRQNILAAVEKHLLKQNRYDVEYRLRHNDGYYVWIHARGQAIWNAEGEAMRMAGSIDDITENKANALQLEKALAFQKLLMSVNTDLIFVKDKEFRIVEANPAFFELYPEAERGKVIGSTTVEHYDVEQASEFLAEDKKAFAEGVSEVVETIDFPDGKKRTLFTKKLCFEDIDNKMYILGIARDITQLKEAEENLIRVNAELEEFSYRTSHDLRSPLISSARLLAIIRDNIQAGDINKAISYIIVVQNSLEKLENLVSDILSLAKLNHSDLPSIRFDVKELIDSSLDKLSHMHNYERIQFSIEDEFNRPVDTSIEHMTLIIENLLSNAIKYQDIRKEQSVVHISIKHMDNDFVITVTDNGLGIPERSRDKLFSMFKRFHPNTAFGSGLGLYMIKRSADKMGGTIDYRDTGDGSQFIFKMAAANFLKKNKK